MARSGMEDPDDMEMLFGYHRALDTAVDKFAARVHSRTDYEFEEDELDRCKTILKQIIPQMSVAEGAMISSILNFFLATNFATHMMKEEGVSFSADDATESLSELMEKMTERGPFSARSSNKPTSREEARERVEDAINLGKMENPADEIIRRADIDLN